MDVKAQAARLGVETQYWDASGKERFVTPEALDRIVAALAGFAKERRVAPGSFAIRQGQVPRLRLETREPVTWALRGGQTGLAQGDAQAEISLPPDLGVGSFDLEIRENASGSQERVPLLIAPERAYQGEDADRRMWALAVQLYSVRSPHNWGHGDFSDLLSLIDVAAQLGAGGVGLNPLHALFDEDPQASPYSPNSRLFLNSLYIDLHAVPEFPGLEATRLQEEIERLRAEGEVDYSGVGRAKQKALRATYGAFCRSATPGRRAAFEAFRRERGTTLARFASFEVLRRRFQRAWWEWPQEWRRPTDAGLTQLRAEAADELGYFEFVQWLAHDQLQRCCNRAREHGLPIGLYLDIAVGVQGGGFDAWSEQEAVLQGVSVGAPPDAMNTAGQNWGLAAFNPGGMEARNFEPFRNMLRASMRYAGAVRIDHVLGLKRTYVVPYDFAADAGTYIRQPFESLLAVVAQESVENKCIVIGEDLGTVPEGFRETLSEWGIWSYKVMLFERRNDGSFKAPPDYAADALATFSTHDLPTFAGWRSGRDLAVKRSLGMDPGESDAQREDARQAMRSLLASGADELDFPSVAKQLASAPARLVVIALEDILGIEDQPNVPGTFNEHPNWKRRLPMPIDSFASNPGFRRLADTMRQAGRSYTS